MLLMFIGFVLDFVAIYILIASGILYYVNEDLTFKKALRTVLLKVYGSLLGYFFVLMLGCASFFALWAAFGHYENTQPTKWESIYKAGSKQTVEVKRIRVFNDKHVFLKVTPKVANDRVYDSFITDVIVKEGNQTKFQREVDVTQLEGEGDTIKSISYGEQTQNAKLLGLDLFTKPRTYKTLKITFEDSKDNDQSVSVNTSKSNFESVR